MPVNVKELIVVLLIAIAVFRLAKPIALVFMSPEDLSRRRNVWLVLTILAFLSPSFWLFVLIAVPLLFAAGRRDSNPSALYLMLLHVIPPMEVPVPMVGMPYIFIANNYLLLSFCVMTPAALRVLRANDPGRIRGLQAMDLCLIAYGILTAILFVHAQTPSGDLYPATVTDCLRRAFVFLFLTIVPYFVISRSSANRRTLLDLMATFCLSCAVLASIALFETARHWLLYGEMAGRWGYASSINLYVLRAESLRAMASTGHPLALGHLLVVAFGFWLYLQSHVQSRATRFAGIVLFWLGLLAAYSRGPWIAAVIVYFAFAALRSRGVSQIFKAGAVAAAVLVLVTFSPFRDRFANVFPFLGGTVDSYNIQYRHRLFDRSWQIIKESPIFGDQSALLKMQDLRQGQGIIDLVNTYLQVLLDNGFVGLSLFLAFILIALVKAWARIRETILGDPDLGLLGASLVSCIVATLLLLENGSFGTGAERIFYILAAMAAAFAHAAQLHRAHPSQPMESRHVPVVR